MAIKAEQINTMFPILTPGMDLHPLPFNGPEFYEGLDREFGDFHKHVLISCHNFDSAWSTWEMHPQGDECVILLSGTATMVVLGDGGEESVKLSSPGEYIVVPRGAWHTASDASNAAMLFITPGQGTQNREQPPRG